jgi:hypothetical protein
MLVFDNVLCGGVRRSEYQGCVVPSHSLVITFSLLSRGICCSSGNSVVVYVAVNIHTVLLHQIWL